MGGYGHHDRLLSAMLMPMQTYCTLPVASMLVLVDTNKVQFMKRPSALPRVHAYLSTIITLRGQPLGCAQAT